MRPIFVLIALALAAPLTASAELRIVRETAAGQAIPAAVRAQLPNVCQIWTQDGGGSGSMGSGTYLGDRLILTAWHVIRDARGQQARVVFPDAAGEPRAFQSTARVLAASAKWDQALLELSQAPPKLRGVQLAAANPKRGDWAILAGYSTKRLAMRPGRVVEFWNNGNPNEPADYYHTNRPAVSGDSGGAMFTETGLLIGNIWGSDDSGAVGQVTGRTHAFLRPVFARLQAWQNATAGVARHGGRVLVTPIFRRAIVNPPAASAATAAQGPATFDAINRRLDAISAALNIPTTQCGPGGCTPPNQYQPQPPGQGPSQYGGDTRPTEPSRNGSTPPLQPPTPGQGKPPELRLGIGRTETLPAGSPARVDIRQEGADTWLDFYLPTGAQGQAGAIGPPPNIDPAQLAGDIAPHLPPITVQPVGDDGRAKGPAAIVPLGGQLNLHHKLTEAQRRTYTEAGALAPIPNR